LKLEDAVVLIKNDRITNDRPGIWADLGAGSGLLTRALAICLGAGSKILAVDKKQGPAFPPPANKVVIDRLLLDFVSDALPFRDLHGIMMANSLHYVKDKPAFVEKIKPMLRPDGVILIVEYDASIAVPVWVPFPVDFGSLTKLFIHSGFASVKKLNQYPSAFGRMMYSAVISV
jgi:SAM-dependent methyltransferase